MIRIGVIRGGTNKNDYQKSISNGSILLRALRSHDEYQEHDILIDQDENWHLDGVPILPSTLIHKIDIAILTIKHPLLNNGYVENILKSLGIKTVSIPKESLRGYIPESLKEKISNIGIHLPRKLEIDFNDPNLANNIHKTFSPPYSFVVYKDNGELHQALHFNTIQDLFDNLEQNEINIDHKYFIEEYIHGDQWAVTVIPNFRGFVWYSLHPVYMDTVKPAFRSNTKLSHHAQSKFAGPNVKNSLDLYSKLIAGSLKPTKPITLIFRDNQIQRPTLMHILERHLLEDDELLQNALQESVITEGEYLAHILQNYN